MGKFLNEVFITDSCAFIRRAVNDVWRRLTPSGFWQNVNRKITSSWNLLGFSAFWKWTAFYKTMISNYLWKPEAEMCPWKIPYWKWNLNMSLPTLFISVCNSCRRYLCFHLCMLKRQCPDADVLCVKLTP